MKDVGAARSFRTSISRRRRDVKSRLRTLAALAGKLCAYARLKRVTWLDAGSVAACRYPRTDAALSDLAKQGVGLLINLNQRPHAPEQVACFGIVEIHLPVPDFTAPTLEQLEFGVHAVESAVSAGTRVAVTCGAGLGRTGTLLACWLVGRGQSADEAIAKVRAVRPGSIETPAQEAAVQAFGRRHLNP